jgi:hypothetical protein
LTPISKKLKEPDPKIEAEPVPPPKDDPIDRTPINLEPISKKIRDKPDLRQPDPSLEK